VRHILDRERGHAGFCAAPDIRRHALRIAGERIPEIGVGRHVRGLGYHADMIEHGIERRLAVGATEGPGSPGTGRRHRLETELLQVARRADVPRIG
jgi:hypothetical protein